MTRQLVFDLPVRVSRDRGDFFLSEANRLAVARLDDTSGWTQGKLALVGPGGAGKTHLAHIWAEAEGGSLIGLDDVAEMDISGVARPLAVEVPDAALAATAEEALFHLHNHMGQHALPLLLVARTPPARWTIALPDLKSRMDATEVVRIDQPDDALLSAVLLKLFADRQLQVTPRLIAWMVPRIERSFRAAQEAVATLDAAALSQKRRISRDLARDILDNPPSKAR
ncbi:MAG: chromosomal replication initiator DnaA [Boseongicola sp.]|nr:chromosomal replication initiator DnaA [Boseongicola sp.]